MKSFHFVCMDEASQTKIDNYVWTDFSIKHHQNQEKLVAFLGSPSENFVFLDIDSQTESECIKSIIFLSQMPCKIIVVSKDTSFAYTAIKVGVHGYVLKSNFIKDILSISSQNNRISNNKLIVSKIAIHCTDAVHYLNVNEIIRCQAESNYTRIIMGKKNILIAKTLKKVETLLPPTSFYRPHRSHLVNLSHVKMVRHEKGGVIVTSDDYHVPISRNRKGVFWNEIQSVTV